jgi:hypothetical protein
VAALAVRVAATWVWAPAAVPSAVAATSGH